MGTGVFPDDAAGHVAGEMADDDDLAAGEALAAALDLELLPQEGGLFRRTFTGGGVSAILFMLIGDDFSAMHRLASDEIYFHHSGSPLRLLLIDPEGTADEVVIGPDALSGEQPQCHVRANWWQGSSSDGPWSLVSTVVAPEFDWHDFVLADREELVALSPDAADRIEELTRRQPRI